MLNVKILSKYMLFFPSFLCGQTVNKQLYITVLRNLRQSVLCPLCTRDKDRDIMTIHRLWDRESGGLWEDYFLFMTSSGVCESCKAVSLIQTRRCKQCIPCGEPGINGNNLFRTDTGPVTHMALSKNSHYWYPTRPPKGPVLWSDME